MDGVAHKLDWSHAEAFVAVAQTGSLSAAARKLGQSQPTVGRHIQALEQAFRVELFRRVPRGLEPTAAALNLLPHAEAMAESAARLSLAAAGQVDLPKGTVRLTASVVMAHFVLPDLLARLRQEHPEIQIELVATDSTENLLFREADLAIRMYRPEQADLIARHIADQTLGLYAAKAYLSERGRPTTLDALMAHDHIGFDRSELAIKAWAQAGIPVDASFFALRTDDQAAYWQLVRSGCGIGAIQTRVGDKDPTVERVMPDLQMAHLPIWLAAPKALHHTARIRLVWDWLARALRQPA